MSPLSLSDALQSLRRAPAGTALLTLLLGLGACDGADRFAPPDPAAGTNAPADAVAQVTPLETAALVTGQRIIYSSYSKGLFDLVTMNPQGGSVVTMTTPPPETEPSWSWDNKRIALVRPRTNSVGQTRKDIYIMNADGSNGHWARSTTTNADLFHPSWSPNGSRLVLTMLLNGTYYVAYLNLTTGQVAAYSTGYGGLPGLMPSYTKAGKIVFVSAIAKAIFMMNADGTGVKTLLSSTVPVLDATVSPDGLKLAYAKLVSPPGDLFNKYDLFVKNLSTGATKRLTFDEKVARQPTWSPDGSRIAFVINRSAQPQIWTMTATGGSQTQITTGDAIKQEPSWSH